jgi:hypothetical protein
MPCTRLVLRRVIGDKDAYVRGLRTRSPAQGDLCYSLAIRPLTPGSVSQALFCHYARAPFSSAPLDLRALEVTHVTPRRPPPLARDALSACPTNLSSARTPSPQAPGPRSRGHGRSVLLGSTPFFTTVVPTVAPSTGRARRRQSRHVIHSQSLRHCVRDTPGFSAPPGAINDGGRGVCGKLAMP